MLMYQLTRMCREKGAVKHDDRVDALALGIKYFQDILAISAKEAAIAAKREDWNKMLTAFINHPQELGICVLTAGLLANSKLMISPEDAIKSSFDIYKRIQDHVARYQSMTFASNIENVFTERAPEVEGD